MILSDTHDSTNISIQIKLVYQPRLILCKHKGHDWGQHEVVRLVCGLKMAIQLGFNIAVICAIWSDRITLHLASGSKFFFFRLVSNKKEEKIYFLSRIIVLIDHLIFHLLITWFHMVLIRSISHKYLLYWANKSWKVNGFPVWCLGKHYPASILGIAQLVLVASLLIVFCLVFFLRSIISIAWQAGMGKARFMLYLLFSLNIFLNFILCLLICIACDTLLLF